MWLNVLRQSYYKLLAIGMGALAIYLAGMYFLISPDINIEKLQAPLFMRGFSYATLSATLMLSLQQVMSFKHFFQSLSVFNMLHMTIGGVMGAAPCVAYRVGATSDAASQPPSVTAPDGGDSSGEGLLAAACDDFLDFV